jgi:hypothetical protein
MTTKNRVVSGLILMSLALAAQVRERDLVPLKHWAAPLYWEPGQAARDASAVQPNVVGPNHPPIPWCLSE